MKTLGRILVVLVVLIVAMAGSIRILGPRWDAESKQFAESSLNVVASQWNPADMQKLSGEEMRAATSDENLRALAQQFSDMLGPIKKIKGIKGESSLMLGSNTGLTAAYVVQAEFAKGSATVNVKLGHENGEWKLAGFRINPVLPDAPDVRVLGMGRVNFSNGDPALMLRYETSVSIDDRATLAKEADGIWPRFRVDVMNSGLSNAVISANERQKDPRIVSNSRGFNFVYRKTPDGSWERMKEDNTWEKVP